MLTNSNLLTNDTSSIQTTDPATVSNTLTVADSTARLALTYGTGTGQVQIGDLVRQTDTGVVYLLVGDTPSNAAHWQQVSALPASILASGQVALARGGTGADLSATGGTGQVLKQSTAGEAITVGTIDLDSLSDVANSGGTLDFGNTSTPVTTIVGGKGATNASPGAFGVRGTGGSGSNVAGGDLNLDAGPGTGNAAAGTGRLRATSAGSSGSTLQSSWVDVLAWSRSTLNASLPVTFGAAAAGANGDCWAGMPSSGVMAVHGSSSVALRVAGVNVLTCQGTTVTLANSSYFNLSNGAGAPATTAYGFGAESGASRWQVPSSGQARDYVGATCMSNLSSTGLAINKGTTAASRMLEIIDSATSQLRLTHTAGAYYVDLRADGSGNLTIAPSGSMTTLASDLRIALPTVPATSSETGSSGTIAWDTNYIYVCTATNTWKRAALSTW